MVEPTTFIAAADLIEKPQRKHIGGLDGMRALAAIAVLFYHYLPQFAPGGLLGVDVFFVLSGFLITALLAAEYERTRKLNIWRFWVRRFRRLVPAVTITVLVCVSAAYFVSRDLLVGIRTQVLGALTFTFNWFDIATGQSYFTDANPQLLRNMWSLAVEQQFYLIWPLLLLLFVFPCKRKFRWLIPAFLAVAATATMGFLFAHGASQTRIYEGTFTHSLGLMLGASLAFLGYGVLTGKRDPISTGKRYLRGGIGWLGIAVVSSLVIALPAAASFLYPWGFLLASLATVAIIQSLFPEVIDAAGPGRLLLRILELRPLKWLGERSYSLYLWHWPVFLIVGSFAGLNAYLVAAISSLISLVAAVLSYRFVETPMRKNGVFRSLGHGITRIFARTSGSTVVGVPRRFGYLVTALAALALPALTAIALANPPHVTGAQLNVERGAQALKLHQQQLAQSSTHSPSSFTPAPDKSSQQLPQAARRLAPASAKKKPQPQSNYPSPFAPNMVSVVGDSVTLAAGEALVKEIPTAAVDAEVSRSVIAGTKIVEELKASGKLRPYLVYSLATNSDFTLAQGRELMSLVGPKERVVFVTGYGPSADYWISNSNKVIHELQKLYPQQVRIADWENAIKNRADLLASDHVHPGPEGASIYAQQVLQALRSFN